MRICDGFPIFLDLAHLITLSADFLFLLSILGLGRIFFGPLVGESTLFPRVLSPLSSYFLLCSLGFLIHGIQDRAKDRSADRIVPLPFFLVLPFLAFICFQNFFSLSRGLRLSSCLRVHFSVAVSYFAWPFHSLCSLWPNVLSSPSNSRGLRLDPAGILGSWSLGFPAVECRWSDTGVSRDCFRSHSFCFPSQSLIAPPVLCSKCLPAQNNNREYMKRR